MAGWSFKVSGMEELINKMSKLPDEGAKIASEARYDGAGVVADSVGRAVKGIRAEPFKYAANGQKRKPSQEEKQIVDQAKHGVAKFRKNGLSVQTSVGFQNTGYADITWNHAKSGNSRTKYKEGKKGRMVHASQGTGSSKKPVPLIVNSINSGTSFMEKQPFLRKAFSQSKGPALAVIENEIREKLDKIEL